MVVGEKGGGAIMEGVENNGEVRMHDHRLRLKQRFDIVRKLGQGTYGKVQLGINKKTGQEVAIKTIKKCKIETEADLIRIRREVQIMSSVRHPNIVHIYEVFENSEKMILVMEYCPGGELYDYLSQQKVLQEDEARRIFRQIATAVYYCHIHKICHRDLKLENVLLDDTGSAKIADFGLSNVFKETAVLATFCGSPLYASPEIVKGTPYIGPEVDCWSLGVLLYTLVYGAMPFDGSNFKRLVKQISSGDYFEPKNPSGASSLIRDMLTVDPIKRADIAYICDHPWVNSGYPSSCLREAESLAAETPVRLDLLLSLAPTPPANAEKLLVPNENTEASADTSIADISAMSVEPSNSAERRILELVAEGGADAIKPSPTRVIVSADHRNSLFKDEEEPANQPNEPEKSATQEMKDLEPVLTHENLKQTRSDMSVSSPIPETPKEEIKELQKPESPTKPRVTVKKKIITPQRSLENNSIGMDRRNSEVKDKSEEGVSEKMQAISIKPNSGSCGRVGEVRDQLERRASLAADATRNTKYTSSGSGSKWNKSQSEDREIRPENVRLENIGVQPPPSVGSSDSGGSNLSLEEARRSLQNSMAALTASAKPKPHNASTGSVVAPEQKRRARDTISSILAAKGNNTKPVYRTEAILRIPDRRATSRGASIERVIPIHLADDGGPVSPPVAAPPMVNNIVNTAQVVSPTRVNVPPTPPVSLSRRSSSSSSGEPIKKSAREFIIPIAVEGVGYVTPDLNNASAAKPVRRSSLVSGEDSEEEEDKHSMHRLRRVGRVGRGALRPRGATAMTSTVTTSPSGGGGGGSSGEEDDDEPFELLTADNLFSTLLQRVRALTNRLNGDEGTGGFPSHHTRNLFDNFQSPFFERRAGELRPRIPRGGRTRRVSRFLRPDFYDAPSDNPETHRRRREDEAQRVLREIRARRASAEPSTPTDSKDDCRDPTSAEPYLTTNWRQTASPEMQLIPTWREPSAENFRLTNTLCSVAEPEKAPKIEPQQPEQNEVKPRESRLLRPKSYPYGSFSHKINSQPSEDVSLADDSLDKDAARKSDYFERDEVSEKGKSEVNVSYNVNLKNKQIEENIEMFKPSKKKTLKKSTKVKSTDPAKVKQIEKPEDDPNQKTEKTYENITNLETYINPVKKRSMLQSIGHRLEKLTGSKSNSPENDEKTKDETENKQKKNKWRNQREGSVPLSVESSQNTGAIQRASTLTNVVNRIETSPRRSMSKVLGLFRKNDSKEPKQNKKISPENAEPKYELKLPKESLKITVPELKLPKESLKPPVPNTSLEKPKRPASLFLNGLTRKKYTGAMSDSALITPITETTDSNKKDVNEKPPIGNLKLDFSRLPKFRQNKVSNEVQNPKQEGIKSNSNLEYSRSLSPRLTGDRYDIPNDQKNASISQVKANGLPEHDNEKIKNKKFERSCKIPNRQNESTTPDREDIFDRIRRKSFYNRFNEQKSRRKSNLVGPGASEYNPASRLHPDAAADYKNYDLSPSSSSNYDPLTEPKSRRKSNTLAPSTGDFSQSTRLHPDYASADYKPFDLSPSSSIRYDPVQNIPRYDTSPSYDIDRLSLRRPLSPGLEPSLKYSTPRYIPKYERLMSADLYRSLDRNDRRKINPTSKYLDSGIPAYTRTMSLMDSEKPAIRSTDYATYNPRRRPHNSAYLLKNDEDTPAIDSILERIKERKRATPSTAERYDSMNRSNIPRKSQSDRSECTEKVG